MLRNGGALAAIEGHDTHVIGCPDAMSAAALVPAEALREFKRLAKMFFKGDNFSEEGAREASRQSVCFARDCAESGLRKRGDLKEEGTGETVKDSRTAEEKAKEPTARATVLVGDKSAAIRMKREQTTKANCQAIAVIFENTAQAFCARSHVYPAASKTELLTYDGGVKGAAWWKQKRSEIGELSLFGIKTQIAEKVKVSGVRITAHEEGNESQLAGAVARPRIVRRNTRGAAHSRISGRRAVVAFQNASTAAGLYLLTHAVRFAAEEVKRRFDENGAWVAMEAMGFEEEWAKALIGSDGVFDGWSPQQFAFHFLMEAECPTVQAQRVHENSVLKCARLSIPGDKFETKFLKEKEDGRDIATHPIQRNAVPSVVSAFTRRASGQVRECVSLEEVRRRGVTLWAVDCRSAPVVRVWRFEGRIKRSMAEISPEIVAADVHPIAVAQGLANAAKRITAVGKAVEVIAGGVNSARDVVAFLGFRLPGAWAAFPPEAITRAARVAEGWKIVRTTKKVVEDSGTVATKRGRSSRQNWKQSTPRFA